MNKTVHIIGLAGSLRQESLTKILLETARDVSPENMRVTIFPLHDIPMYNFDIEAEDGFPDAVVALRDAIKGADGLILGTPEYNGSLSGVLKNAIDWASREGLLGKIPVVTIGGSLGALGATKAQEHLRQICLHLGMYVLPRPTIAVPQLPQKVENGVLADKTTRQFIQQQMETFYDWVVRLMPSP